MSGKDSRQDSVHQEQFSLCKICRETFYIRFLPKSERLVKRRHGHNEGRKPAEISVTEFCYKSVNLYLEELKNITIILFLIHELLR